MRTAVIYTGNCRTFADLYANHIFSVLLKLPNPTIFCSMADDEQAEDMRLLEKHLPEVPFFFEKVKQPESIEEPPVHGRFHAGHGVSTTKQAVLKQLWALNRAWEFVGENGGHEGFDLYVRIRSDSGFFRCEMPEITAKFSTGIRNDACLTPWWSRWGGINDRFAIMGRKAAEVYFTTFRDRQKLFDAWCPVHPETMIAFALAKAGITPDDTLKVEFGTFRLSGQIIPCAISPIDIGDYARSK